jgi:hypothetical protein
MPSRIILADGGAEMSWYQLVNANRELEEENAALKQEIEQLKIVIQQHRGALGYPVAGDIPDDPNIICGLCDAREARIHELETQLQLYNRPDITSRTDHDKALERVIEELRNEGA